LDKYIAFIIWARKLEGDRLKTLDFSWVLSENDLWGELIWEKDGRILPSLLCFMENYFLKSLLVYLLLKKLINKKHFLIKEIFGLVSRKVFFFYFKWKILYRNFKKFRNIILFVDYNKFDLQPFDCYIFCFELFFSISPLRL
jgi:hypothetical protein